MKENNNKRQRNQEKEERLSKLNKIAEDKCIPYKDKFEKELTCQEASTQELNSQIKTAGRVVLLRNMGKIAFVQIHDFSGEIQLVFRIGNIEKDNFEKLIKFLDVGDFIGVVGTLDKTKRGEISIFVKDFTFLSKSLRPLPEKWHGMQDKELRYRKRYLDLLTNKESRETFKFKSDFIWELRKFYKEHNFDEVDTPILCNTPSGAMAKPFKTHHNALDMDVYLRIAPEIFLKEAIIGGYEKIFEVARCFRNEGIDPSHLQDFTMIEHYCAYWNFQQNMDFTEEMFAKIIKKLKGTLKLTILDRNGEEQEVDFTPPWERISFKDLLIRDCGIDIDNFPTAAELKKEIERKGIELDDIDNLGRGNMIDSLYKEVSRKKLINPVFLMDHPIDLSPLARKNDSDFTVADRFQLVVNGWEIVNAYSELIDPIDQKNRFDEQMKARQKGDEEAMLKDDKYIEAMEYGMPPVSGWGMGLERIVALLMKQSNLKDTVLFPLMKP
jgi:lysyl-tRNA synthetase class 2